MDAPAGVTQEEGNSGVFHLPSAGLALMFMASRIQPSLSLVDRKSNLYSVYLRINVLHLMGMTFFFFLFLFSEKKSHFVGLHRRSNSRPKVRRFRDYQLNHRGDRLQLIYHQPYYDDIRSS